MYSLEELLKLGIDLESSDLHIISNSKPALRINGQIKKIGEYDLTKQDTEKIAKEILKEDYLKYRECGEFDISFSICDLGRFRANIFKNMGSDSIAIRFIKSEIPTLKDLNYPSIIRNLTEKKRGLILVTGPTGSGKSTTLAAIINEINNNKSSHIVTLEDPIEYIHIGIKSIINQREIGKDSQNYNNALRAVLREDPDVILIGEMRDLESISIAIRAAETGHLVLSTLHTIGAAKTIDRIIDVFPTYQQQQIKIQLSSVLEGIISQQLVKSLDGKRVAAIETMIGTNAIKNQIREGKTHQIETSIQTGMQYGMKTMDMYLADLVNRNIISLEEAIENSVDKDMIKRYLNF